MTEPLPPICENYPDAPVLVLWPSGKVQQFTSLAKAKTFLMRHHFMYIVCDGAEAAEFGELRPDIKERWNVPEECETLGELWQYLIDISVVKDPWTPPDRAPSDSTRMSKRVTSAGYTIHPSKCKEDIKLPKQAKIIAAQLAAENDSDYGMTEDDMEKFIRQLAIRGVLNTKQDPIRIFTYYRKQLIEKGCISLRN